nr:HAD hydrolase family protein [uncultured Thomasclavelia sp.]
MENSYKVIIMDVDGTLTNSEKIVTPKTKEALIKAEKKELN